MQVSNITHLFNLHFIFKILPGSLALSQNKMDLLAGHSLLTQQKNHFTWRTSMTWGKELQSHCSNRKKLETGLTFHYPQSFMALIMFLKHIRQRSRGKAYRR